MCGVLVLLINCFLLCQCVDELNSQLNIVLLADKDRIVGQWADIVEWARARIRNDHLLPDNCTFKYRTLFLLCKCMHYSVVVQPTCPASDDQLADAITNLDRDDFDTQTAVIDAQWQLRMSGQEVHALVGPPCLTGGHIGDCRRMSCAGMVLAGGLAASTNTPNVSYYSVTFQMQTARTTTFNTLSSVQMGSEQQGARMCVWPCICSAMALGKMLSTYNWTKFAVVNDDFILNNYLKSAIEYNVANGLFGLLEHSRCIVARDWLLHHFVNRSVNYRCGLYSKILYCFIEQLHTG